MDQTKPSKIKLILKQLTISWRFFIHLAIGLFLLWLCIPKVESVGPNAGRVFDEIAQDILDDHGKPSDVPRINPEENDQTSD